VKPVVDDINNSRHCLAIASLESLTCVSLTYVEFPLKYRRAGPLAPENRTGIVAVWLRINEIISVYHGVH
jgi:hypothetical protein